MKNKTNKLMSALSVKQALIYDQYHLKYLLNLDFEVGERFIGLLIQENKEPLLILNKLFPKPDDLYVIQYEDHQDPIELLAPYLKDNTLGIDGQMPSRFMLPLIQKGYHLLDISTNLADLRAIKNETEQEKLIQASLLNDAIMEKVKTWIQPGISEKELSDKINQHQSQAPLEGVSFPALVLFNEHAADPHGEPSDLKYKKGDSVLVDMGGYYQGYASDMTRTFIGDDPFHAKIYEIVRQANQAAIDIIRPGIAFGEIDFAARQTIEKHGYGPYFIHRTGHGIGLECHELPNVSQNNPTIVKEGMCFSIEPGIYIEGKIGVRIEDLVLVTKDGAKVLNHYPKKGDAVKL